MAAAAVMRVLEDMVADTSPISATLKEDREEDAVDSAEPERGDVMNANASEFPT